MDNIEQRLASTELLKEREFWKSKLVDFRKTNFFYDSYEVKFDETKSFSFKLDAELNNKLLKLSNNSDNNLHVILASILAVLLSKYLNEDRIVIGSPIDIQKNETNLLNTFLPLRFNFDKVLNFKEVLFHTKTIVNEAISHQNFPIKILLEELSEKKSNADFPLIDTALLLTNIQSKKYIDPLGINFIFSFTRNNNLLEATIFFNSALYHHNTIIQIKELYLNIAETLLSNINVPLKELDLFNEYNKIALKAFNNTCANLPKEKIIHQCFEKQVKLNPRAIAVSDGNTSLTYEELNEKAEVLTSFLIQKGVTSMSIVAILIENSAELIISILGILKVGGVYLPIDLNYPEERIKYILKDSNASLLISLNDYTDNLKLEIESVDIKQVLVNESFIDKRKKRVNISITPKDPAYIIYTSGSTGFPKGVIIKHESVVNYINWAVGQYIKGRDLSFPLFTAVSFDLTVTSIFSPLFSGNRIIIYNEKRPELLFSKMLNDNIVGAIKLTPSHLQLLIESDFSNSSVRCLILGGEDLESELCKKAIQKFKNNIEIYNEYGPTEATVGCMIYKFDVALDYSTSVPIGKPIANNQVYIINSENKPVPKGFYGEIGISGIGLSIGYLNKPELSQNSFISEPFEASPKVYKTGDIAKWVDDDNLVFLGRNDGQVKLNGYRIELKEIENKIRQLEAIDDVFVNTITAQQGDVALCAYYKAEKVFKNKWFIKELESKLPHFMIPAYFVHLEKIPINAHGKINVELLPDPLIGYVDEDDYEPPTSETEKIVTKIWSEVLGREKVGINDDYFSLGGDSIRVLQIINRLRKHNLIIGVEDVYRASNIKNLCKCIRTVSKVTSQKEVTGKIELTPIQRWFFEGRIHKKHHFNQSVMLHFTKCVTGSIIRKIFKKIQDHHDALRMVFKEEGGKIIQENMGLDFPVFLNEYDLSNNKNVQSEILSISNKLQSDIDLTNGPLMRLGLFHVDDGSSLLVVIHHLVVDGISWRILFEDIENLLNQITNNEPLSLPLKTDSFQTWSQYLLEYIKSKTHQKTQKYWDSLLKQEFMPIIRDNPNGDKKVEDSITKSFYLSKEETSRLLTEVHTSFRTQINDVLLTALLLSINKQYKNNAVWVDIESHGRGNILQDVDISRTFGWFTSIYPVLLKKDSDNLGEIIKQVKETLRRVPNDGLDYLMLRYLDSEYLNDNRKTGSYSQISFNYLGQFDTDIEGKSFLIIDREKGNEISPNEARNYDWDISGTIASGKLTMNLTYSKKQYTNDTINAIINFFKESLIEVINYCCSYGKIELTPSDLTYTKLSIHQLDELQHKYNLEDIYLLSPMQENMLFHSLLDNNSINYFEQTTYRMTGDLDIKAIEKSMNDLIARHEVLRTVFLHNVCDRPIQVILKEQKIDFRYNDIQEECSKTSKEEIIRSYQMKDISNTFDLSKDVLMRLGVYKTATHEFEFIWSFHHIVMDGWCMSIIINEFNKFYIKNKYGKKIELPPVKKYSEYIQWIENRSKEDAILYWGKYLVSYDSLATLPKKESLALEKLPVNLKSEELTINTRQKKLLQNISTESGVTLNTILECAWGILLMKYNNTKDVVFGSVVSGRPAEIEGIERMVGLLINTIPVRIKCKSEDTISDLFKRVQSEALESEQHHYHPLTEIQSLSELDRKLLNHIMAFENYPIANEIEGYQHRNETQIEYTISNVKVFEQANYDFIIVVVPGDEIHIRFDFNANLYEKRTIDGIIVHLNEIIEQIISNSKIKITDIEITIKEEKNQLLYEFNKTKTGYPRSKTIAELFEEQVNHTPNSIALVYGEKQISYSDLNEKANQLAEYLKTKGVKQESIVGLMVDRSIEMIIGIFGILKSGSAYLPIEVNTPTNKIKTMLSDSLPDIIISTSDITSGSLYLDLKVKKGSRPKIIKTKQRKQIQNIDDLPIPAIFHINYEKYSHRIGMSGVKNSIAVQCTRGCPYQCIYCHKIWPKTHVIRFSENIYKEIKLYNDIGFRRFTLIDDIFNLNKKNSTDFFERVIKNKLDVEFYFPNGLRGDLLTYDYIDLLVEAGTTNISLALETASERIQKLIKKNIKIDKLRENIDYICKKYPNIVLDLFLMHGFPTETEEEAELTLQFLKESKWIHFPQFSILKIFPNSEMEKLALENGISKEVIVASEHLAYHELPETLPFDKKFTRSLQAEFLNDYFLNKKRLLQVLPYQMKIFTEDELVQKYNSYLPANIDSFDTLLRFIRISKDELSQKEFLPEEKIRIVNLNDKMQEAFKKVEPDKAALKIFLLDLSQFFSGGEKMMYDVAEAPLGLMSILAYLQKKFGEKINGKIAKSRYDFDSYDQLRSMFEDFNPDIIGIRTLSFYKDFYHKTIGLIRQWGHTCPIVAGGPYASSDYELVLADNNIDMVILGEGEVTFAELVNHILLNNKKMPSVNVLEKIDGIAFRDNKAHDTINCMRDVIFIDQIKFQATQKNKIKFKTKSSSNDLAYVMYTSGSTGQAKGVGVNQYSIVRLVKETNYCEINEKDKILQLSNYAFDGSTFDIFGALLNGAQLTMVPKETILDLRKLGNLICKEGISVMFITTALFNTIVDLGMEYLSNIRKLLFGGEKVSLKHTERALKYLGKDRLIHVYGPTESTVYATYYPINFVSDEIGTVPIGQPLSNTEVYVLDTDLKLMPLGVPGELCIGGDGLARGYLNNIELTKEKFIDNPYSLGNNLYRTGDIVRWLPCGNIEFLGRKDEQVKIRGFRIELEEIGCQLQTHQKIKESVILVKEKEGDKFLVAYYVSDEEIDNRELIKFLSSIIPDYMVPAYYVHLERLPLNSNGKIDKKALPEFNNRYVTNYIAPSNEIEDKLVEIWSDILNIDKNEISINQSFFELGGHSLKATILVNKIYKVFGIEVPLKEVFNKQDIESMADFLITVMQIGPEIKNNNECVEIKI